MGRAKKIAVLKAKEMLQEGFPLEQVHAETGIRFGTLEAWKRGQAAPGSPVATDGIASDAGPAIVSSEKGPSLESLSLEHPGAPIGADSSGAIGTGPKLESTGPSVAESTLPKPPPMMDATALIAVTKLTKAAFVQTIAMGWGLSLTEKDVDRLSKFTELEEKQLEVLAPFAAEYTSSLSQYTKPVMACLFLGVVGMSSARSFSELKRMRPPKPAKPAIKPTHSHK